MHILVYSVGTKATRLKAAVYYASKSLKYECIISTISW